MVDKEKGKKKEEKEETQEKVEVVKDAKKDSKKEGKKTSEIAKPRKKKIRREMQRARAYIKCTYNNTAINITDANGGALAWSSSGSLGFKGAKKATPYAATQVVNAVNEKIAKFGVREIEAYVRGVGSGREASIRALANKGYKLVSIKDLTPIPHNGCRPRKPRRV